MRWLAVTLLVANVLLAAWGLERSVHRPPAMPPLLEEGPLSLRTIDELDVPPPLREVRPPFGGRAPDSEAAGGPGEDTAAAELAAASACARIGPFGDEAELERLARWLAEAPVRYRRRVQEGPARKLYWVYLEPASTTDQARARLEDLERRGIGDFMLIARGDLANAISLGVFSSREAAGRRLAELADQGYRPVVVPREERERRWWLDIAARDADSVARVLREAPTAAPARTVECAELGRA